MSGTESSPPSNFRTKILLMAVAIFLSGITCGAAFTYISMSVYSPPPPPPPPRLLQALEDVAQTPEEKEIISREIMSFLLKNKEKSIFTVKKEAETLKQNLIKSLPEERKEKIEAIFDKLSKRLKQ